jgi:hypothetical protein
LSKWLFSFSSPSYSDKIAALASLNNMAAAAVLSSKSIVSIGTVEKVCERNPCDRSLVSLASKFQISVRQLLEHNHRFVHQSHAHLSVTNI